MSPKVLEASGFIFWFHSFTGTASFDKLRMLVTAPS
jgi:hypothetical protein